MSYKKLKCIQDSIYEYIEIGEIAQKIIDTNEFQILRQLKQLGLVHLIYPGANHNRLEHSLGVYHLVGEFLKQLIYNHSKDKFPLNINDRLKEVIKIAGLVHDLGHTILSHFFDHYIAETANVPNHEKRSTDMFRLIVKKYNINIDQEETELICDLILGNERSGYPKWIFQIVANKTFQLDIDKCDYLVRDAYYLGFRSNLQLKRIFSFARVINDMICFHEKVYLQIVDIFNTRYRYHKEVYRHRVVLAIELMVVDMLKILCKICDWKTLFNDGVSWRNISDSLLDNIPLMFPENTLKIEDVFYKEKKELLRLHYKIKNRDIYKKVNGPGENIVEITTILGFSNSLTENPMSKIFFYNDNSDQTFTINSEQKSKLLSKTFVEVETLYYQKN